MFHEFDTIKEAGAAGYDYPGTGGTLLRRHRGYDVRIIDTSGSGSFGYRFAVKAIPDEQLIRDGHRVVGPFGGTVDVSLRQEKNKRGGIGAVTCMFAPGQLEAAINAAILAIDARLNGHG